MQYILTFAYNGCVAGFAFIANAFPVLSHSHRLIFSVLHFPAYADELTVAFALLIFIQYYSSLFEIQMICYLKDHPKISVVVYDSSAALLLAVA